MTIKFENTQWSTVGTISTTATTLGDYIPEEDQARIAAYLQYDQMYWNDPRQYSLRVLEGEAPIYIPNPRVIVDTTSHFLLKGLKLVCENATTQKKLEDFLKREEFYSRFNDAKRAGVARGDFVFHMTADPRKQAGSRISLNAVPAMDVFPIWDEDMPGRMIGATISTPWEPAKRDNRDIGKLYVRRLTYKIEEKDQTRRIFREEGIYEFKASFFGTERFVKVKTILNPGYLDPAIQHIPIYWFKNRKWDGEDFGSSELRGIERISEVVSQGATDISASLALEGLGVYATDGGRPVAENPDGSVTETDWEIAPGRVLELPTGAKMTRIQGVGSITPATDNIEYLEGKLHESLGLSDVARGTVDAQVANSGIALAIKFLPTLAKIDDRDQAGQDRITQMFYDWKTWYEVFEHETLQGDIVPTIGEKLPVNRATQINELNNMKDRQVISRAYYRSEMEKLGYVFPKGMEEEILAEIQRENQARTFVSPTDHENGIDGGIPDDPKTSQGGLDAKPNPNGDTLPTKNRSNNKNRPNESGGTEAESE